MVTMHAVANSILFKNTEIPMNAYMNKVHITALLKFNTA